MRKASCMSSRGTTPSKKNVFGVGKMGAKKQERRLPCALLTCCAADGEPYRVENWVGKIRFFLAFGRWQTNRRSFRGAQRARCAGRVTRGRARIMGHKRCPHGKVKRACAECTPCPHGRVKSDCAECKGCTHGKLKNRCVECTPCPHGKVKYSSAACKSARAERSISPEVKLEPEIKQEPFTIRGYFGIGE